MTRFFVRTAALTIAVATLAVFTAAAKDDEIEEGVDYWRTPANGSTFTFPAGDVEHLCHKAADSSWDHKISLKGVPAKGSDWDSAVSRITDAEFHHGSNTATTRVHFKSLSLTSSAPNEPTLLARACTCGWERVWASNSSSPGTRFSAGSRRTSGSTWAPPTRW